MATKLEDRVYELEKAQALYEKDNAAWQGSMEERTEFQLEAFAQRLESVEGAQVAMNETMNGLKTGIDTIISRMDKEAQVKAAVDGDRRTRKWELKDWVITLSGFVVALGALISAIGSFIKSPPPH